MKRSIARLAMLGAQRAPCVEYREEDKSNEIYDPSTVRLGAKCKIQRPETSAEYVESNGQSGQIDVREMEFFQLTQDRRRQERRRQ